MCTVARFASLHTPFLPRRTHYSIVKVLSAIGTIAVLHVMSIPDNLPKRNDGHMPMFCRFYADLIRVFSLNNLYEQRNKLQINCTLYETNCQG
jgi:hypothetical protein